MIEDLFESAWNSVIGAEGTLHIGVASRTFLLVDHSQTFEQQSFRRFY